MAPLGLGAQPAESPVHGGSDIEDLLEYVTTAEEGFEALFGALSSALPDVEGVDPHASR